MYLHASAGLSETTHSSMRHANGHNAQAQSGCLPYGSPLTMQRHQSATRHRQVGRASCGARRTETALSRSASIRQNLRKSTQGSMPMNRPNINIHRHSGVFSSALPSVTCLTRRSRGRPLTASLRQRLMGAPYLGRWAS